MKTLTTITTTKAGKQVEHEYVCFESVADALENLGESETLALINRQTLVDARNRARQGITERATLTPEQKAERSKELKNRNALAKLLAQKGIKSVDDPRFAEILEAL